MKVVARKPMAAAVTGLLFIAGSLSTALAEEDPTIAAGKQRFLESCAVCHGEDGKGRGIAAGHLKQKPADLTQLTKNNNGHFPAMKMYQTIDGRGSPGVHGSREMPIWGAEFRGGSTTAAGMTEAVVRGRILELIVFLESIQE